MSFLTSCVRNCFVQRDALSTHKRERRLCVLMSRIAGSSGACFDDEVLNMSVIKACARKCGCIRLHASSQNVNLRE